jgi:putative Ca2+/H+ antiporter (TMEM165/GDT1 family)
MTEIPKDLKRLLFGMGTRWHAWAAIIQDTLGLVCLIMGIISGAMNRELGLEPTYWFLAAIAFIIFGLSAWLTSYHTAKEG